MPFVAGMFFPATVLGRICTCGGTRYTNAYVSSEAHRGWIFYVSTIEQRAKPPTNRPCNAHKQHPSTSTQATAQATTQSNLSTNFRSTCNDHAGNYSSWCTNTNNLKHPPLKSNLRVVSCPSMRPSNCTVSEHKQRRHFAIAIVGRFCTVLNSSQPILAV